MDRDELDDALADHAHDEPNRSDTGIPGLLLILLILGLLWYFLK